MTERTKDEVAELVAAHERRADHERRRLEFGVDRLPKKVAESAPAWPPLVPPGDETLGKVGKKGWKR